MNFLFSSRLHRNHRMAKESLQSSWQWLGFGIGLFVLLNIFRLREALPQAGLRMEDVYYFNTYYDHAVSFWDVLQRHSGQPYLIPWTNFFAWWIAASDIRVQPYLYQWTGFLGAIVAVALPFCSGMIRSRLVFALGPLLLGCVGLNHALYSLTLIYTMYTGVLIALCVLFFDSPRTRTGTIFLGLAVFFLPWFGPYSVLIVPVGLLLLLFFWEDRKRRLLLCTALCSTGLYFLIGVERGTSNILQLKQLWIVQTYLHMLLEDIVLFGLIGTVSLWYWLLVLSLLAVVFFVLRNDHQYLKYAFSLLVLIAVALLLIFASNRYPLTLYVLPCHKMISLFFWMVFLLYTLDRLFMTLGTEKIGSTLFIVCSLSLLLIDHGQHPEKWSVRSIPQQKAFLLAIRYYESLGLKEHNQYIVLKLKSHPDAYWKPKVRVGSQKPEKKRIEKKDLAPPWIGEEFIVGVKKEEND